VAAREGLPEHHTHRPHVAGGGRRFAAQPLRRDVRERPGHVSDGRERLGLGEAREPEVEQADRDLRLVLQQDIRRLDVAVHDPLSMRVRETFQDLRGGLDRGGVCQLPASRRLAQGRAGDVLVRDVHVLPVACVCVDALAAGMAEFGSSAGLTLRARACLAFARDDLERHVQTRLLVPRKPDRAGAAAAQRPDRAVPGEYELAGGEGDRRALHLLHRFGHACSMSFTGRTKGYSDSGRTGSNRYDRT
jgi:hypothetical protein